MLKPDALLQDIITFNEGYSQEVKATQNVVRVQNTDAATEIIYVLSASEVLIHFDGVANFGDYYQLLKARKAVDLFATRQSDRLKKQYDAMKYDFAKQGYTIYRGEQLVDLPSHHTFMIGIPKNKWSEQAHTHVLTTIVALRQQEQKICTAIGGYKEQIAPPSITVHARTLTRLTTYIEEAATFAKHVTAQHNEQFVTAISKQLTEKMTRTLLPDGKTVQLQSTRYTMIINLLYVRIITNHNAVEEDLNAFFGEEIYKQLKYNQKNYSKLQEACKEGVKSSRNTVRCERIERLLTRYFDVQRIAYASTFDAVRQLYTFTGEGIIADRRIHLLVHPTMLLAFNEVITKSGMRLPSLDIIYQPDHKPNLHFFEGQGLTNGHGVQIFSIYMLAKDTRKELAHY